MALAVAAVLPASASEKTVGLLGGVSTDLPAPLAGVFFGLEPLPHLRITPSVSYQFEQKHTDAFRLAIDVQSPWSVAGTRFRVYPLAGVSVSRFNVDRNTESGSHHIDRIGFNVGGGLEWKPSKLLGLKIFVEGKYAYSRRFDTGLVTAGIGYAF